MFKKSVLSGSMGLCLGVGAALLTTGAQADILVLIDLTTVDEVTITALPGFSAVTTSGSDTTGIYFEDFYISGSGLSAGLVAGDFTNAENPSDGSPALFRSGTDPGLNVWSFSSDSTVTFTSGSLAFVGSATWTLSAAEYGDMIALGSRSGDLWFPADTVDDLPGALVLGTYDVIVPAPGAVALLGIAGVATRRRRRNA